LLGEAQRFRDQPRQGFRAITESSRMIERIVSLAGRRVEVRRFSSLTVVVCSDFLEIK
jgi:hypothetical protein